MPKGAKAPDYTRRKVYYGTGVECHECDYTNKEYADPTTARRLARNHMRKTGHKITVYHSFDEWFIPEGKTI